METPFTAGQTVALRAQPEQRMTVGAIRENGHVECVWFNERRELQTGVFPPCMLQEKEPPQPIGFRRNAGTGNKEFYQQMPLRWLY
jgi:uncharacterized protein YodC (DUF2158 family)